jgi:hypothetical protein
MAYQPANLASPLQWYQICGVRYYIKLDIVAEEWYLLPSWLFLPRARPLFALGVVSPSPLYFAATRVQAGAFVLSRVNNNQKKNLTEQ